jgi:hypothetical protein
MVLRPKMAAGAFSLTGSVIQRIVNFKENISKAVAGQQGRNFSPMSSQKGHERRSQA